MSKVRIILRGHFQCSPDGFDTYHHTVVVDSKELHSLAKEGYLAVGAEIENSEESGTHETASNTASVKIAAEIEKECAYCKDECPKNNERCSKPRWARQLRHT